MENTKGRKADKIKTIMIGCPEDAEKEFLNVIKEAIQEFNEKAGRELGIQLKTRHWREETYSDARNAQESINKQLCDASDYLLTVFYCSLGSAVASKKPGTYEEIEYFKKQQKHVFIHRFAGETTVNLADRNAMNQLSEYLNNLKEDQKNFLIKNFRNAEELKKGIIEDLTLFLSKTNKIKSVNENARKGTKNAKTNTRKKARNPIQDSMKSYIRHYDEWASIKTRGFKFSFEEKAKDLIAGMQEDGSVQYYVGKQERFRTTPTASTLDALYLADLLPDDVRYKMQDWICSSRKDSCDHPKGGYEPEDCDKPGWSCNEGVSVWTTSKALGTLIMTGYYARQEVFQNEEIMRTTYEALGWLADQEYEKGGWGFQYLQDMKACEPSVTMTALALKVITKFLLESYKNEIIKFDYDLEKKLSDAKSRGITYLLSTMKEDKESKHVYWEYDNKPSLTGTVWVLDFINVAQGKEAGELYNKRGKIVSYCVSRFPSCPREYEEYKEEVYFVGGKTKYKPVRRYNKFYAYLPYHIPVILQSGVKLNEDQEERMRVCIHALTKGKESYWFGTDACDGASQPPTCFARAMALSVVAFWMKNTSARIISEMLKEDWDPEEYDNEKSR